jgi:hypothetical protein
MKSDPYPHLQQFFGGYFHQDWTLEAEDWQGLAANFIAGADPSTLLNTCQELSRLLNEIVEDGELDDVLGGLGCCYRPIEMGNRDWLRGVQKMLLQAVG